MPALIARPDYGKACPQQFRGRCATPAISRMPLGEWGKTEAYQD